MRHIITTTSYLILASLSACASSTANQSNDNPKAAPPAEATEQTADPKEAEESDDAASQPASMPAGASSMPAGATSPAAIRAAEATARLEATEAGTKILASINAHGGLAAFYGLKALHFRFRYAPVKGPVKDSRQTIDLLESTAHHTLLEPMKGQLAWTGHKAWLKLDSGEAIDGDAPPFPARFWALTPYYFVAMPFVMSDPGVRLEVLKEDPTKAGFPKGTTVIKAGFDEGTGDAPDDSYVLFLAPKTNVLLGLRYTVTYAPFFAGKDVKRTPEKLVVYEKPTTLNGVIFFAKESTYQWTGGKRGALVTNIEVSEYAAKPDFVLPAMPKGAVVDRSMD